MITTTSSKTPQEILNSIIDALHMRITTFAKGMDMPYFKVFDICRGKTRTFTDTVIKAIVERYNVNETYLLTGEGAMFKEDPLSINATSDDVTNSFLRVTSALSERNTKLQEEINRLKGILDDHGIAY